MNCPVCDSQTRHFSDPKLSILYHHCPKCDYIFKDPVNRQGLSEQKKRYDLHDNDPGDSGYRAYFQRFLDYILPRVPRSGVALDFGSGTSDLLTAMLVEAGYDAVRYDPIYHSDESYLGMTYDLIVSTEVFEHLSDPLETLQHLSGLLSTNGHIALQTQFHPIDREEFMEWYYRLDPTHIGFFTVDTFEVVSALVDLELIDDDGTNKVILRHQ